MSLYKKETEKKDKSFTAETSVTYYKITKEHNKEIRLVPNSWNTEVEKE